MMITGAGISVGSGIDTYRGVDGTYTAIEKEVGMRIDQLLSPKMLQEKPELIWKYWLKVSLSLQDKQPSLAHRAIKSIADQATSFLEVTQNFDGLSVKAGLREDQLIELHGTARRYHCMSCGRHHAVALSEDMALPPKCYVCAPAEGATIRPTVVMFNEFIDNDHYDKAAAFASTADVLIISGTSMQFPYLFRMVGLAIEHGAVIVYIDPEAEVNPAWFQVSMHTSRTKPLEDGIFCIRKTADEILPLIADDFDRCIGDLIALHKAGINQIDV